MKMVLPTLKFNKYEGHFEHHLPVDFPIPTKFKGVVEDYSPKENFDNFLNIPGMVLGGQDCCVCMEKTKTRTSCGHAVCLPCRYALKKEICPMCRTKLNPEESDDSDEE
jgi:hypothetical protein